VNDFFNLLNPSVRTEMNARSRKMFPGSRALPVLRADNITTIYEPIASTRHVQLQTGSDLLFSVKTARDLPAPPYRRTSL
jgi:hypothetical protein